MLGISHCLVNLLGTFRALERIETDSHGNKRTIYSLRNTHATFRLQKGILQFILAIHMGTSVATLEEHYDHTSNVASAAELAKGGTFKGNKATKAVNWL